MSFSDAGARSEACSGDGILKVEMHFLPDVYVPCEVCGGKRYNRETLEVRYKGKTIYDVLEMTVEEALDFFKNVPRILNKVQTLYDVGLGYLKLGQPSTTLSGGEAQRIKLATELSKRSTGKTIYVLDEPTTGLDPRNRKVLINIIKNLDKTKIITTHDLDMAMEICQRVIVLSNGKIVADGNPHDILLNEDIMLNNGLELPLGKY